MATLLCASCGHSFPDTLVEPASFSDRVGRCLSETSQLVRDTQGKTSADTHRLVQLGQLLQQLCGMMEEEVRLLQGRQKEGRGGFSGAVGMTNGTHSTNVKGSGGARGMPIAGKRGGAAEVLTLTQGTSREAALMNGTLASTVRQQQQQQQQQQMMTLTNASGTGGPTLKMFDGAVPTYQLKRMVTAFDLVSATLYNVLESLAVQCRAGVALLWLRPRQNASSDLVAPFVVGRELTSLAHSAPYSTPEASVPCVVCQTGVALNMLPQPNPPAAMMKGVAADLSLTELMEQTNAAQLLIPVHDRYTERNTVASSSNNNNTTNHSTNNNNTTASAAALAGSGAAPRASVASPAGFASVIAVVHLIGSPLHPAPFHRHNEESAAQTAALLSYILSSYYDAMMAEWANRFYVPTTLHATSKYTASLDMRPEEKVMDDFTAPPLLMYRTTVSNPRELQSANEARDALKLLQHSALRKAAPLRPMANVKDLCQHATNMEANWVSAVQQTSRLEKEIGTLEEDLLRRDVGALQRAQDGRGGGGGSGAAGRRSLQSSASATQLSVAGAARRAAQLPAMKERSSTSAALPAMPTSSASNAAAAQIRTASATAASAADILKSFTSLDIPLELTPALPASVDGGAPVGSPVTALSGDVLKPEEMELLEAVTLRRLKTLGADTTIFETTS